MKLFIPLLLSFAAAVSPANAQKADSSQQIQQPSDIPAFTAADLAAQVPVPKPDDVKTTDGILRAIYDVISGPAGNRDWNRFRSLFLPHARFTQTAPSPDGKSAIVISWNEEEFIRDAGEVFAKEAFYENAIVNKADVYGNMAQVFSSYESRHRGGEKPFQRGINSIQLLNDGARWWVVSILWDSEHPGNLLPGKFTKKKRRSGRTE